MLEKSPKGTHTHAQLSRLPLLQNVKKARDLFLTRGRVGSGGRGVGRVFVFAANGSQ